MFKIPSFPFFLSFLLYCYPLCIFSLSVSDLSLEEKVGQLLLVHFHGDDVNEEARQLVQELHVGGIIYYNWANDLSSPGQVQNLSQGLQQLAQKTSHSIPLFIAVDQEGGVVNRLKKGFTIFPGHYALGQTGEFRWGEESAWMMGKEMKLVGISLNLAPVVDVYTQPANPVIGIRAFSSDPFLVAKWGEYTLRGYKKARVIATLKHFPGHGDVQVDSHEALPSIRKKREILDQIELHPFRMLASQADAIMTAHLFIPELDREQCVTFSKKAVDDLLRKEFHFSGIIITDSLAMQGALSQVSSLEEAVLKSLNAGHDLILLGGKQLLDSQAGLEFTTADIKRVQQFLIDAVKQGKLSEQRINESVARLLDLKRKFGLFDFVPLNPALLKTDLKTAVHCTLAQRIAERAIHVVKGQNHLPIRLEDSDSVVIAPDLLREEFMQTDWKKKKILYFKDLNPDSTSIQEILSSINQKKVVLFTYNAWQFSGQQELFKQIKNHVSSTVAIVVRNPFDAHDLNIADVIMCTFSPVAVSLQAAFDDLVGKTEKIQQK